MGWAPLGPAHAFNQLVVRSIRVRLQNWDPSHVSSPGCCLSWDLYSCSRAEAVFLLALQPTHEYVLHAAIQAGKAVGQVLPPTLPATLTSD